MVERQLERRGYLTLDFETGRDGTSSMPETTVRETRACTGPDIPGTSDKKDCKMAGQAHCASVETGTVHGCLSCAWFSGEDRLGRR